MPSEYDLVLKMTITDAIQLMVHIKFLRKDRPSTYGKDDIPVFIINQGTGHVCNYALFEGDPKKAVTKDLVSKVYFFVFC